MTIHSLTAPEPTTVGFIGSESDPAARCWIVYGVGFTDSDEVADYASRAGYSVANVSGVPEEYQLAVSRLEAYPTSWKNASIDGADPDSIYRRVGSDGTTIIDIRDVISGTITA